MERQVVATVLLVEDSEALARLTLRQLRDEACRVVHAATGAEALQWLTRETPDVILLDLMLPDMNGMEILRQVTARGLSAPVIITTAHGSVDVAVEAMREGAYNFLEKPCPLDRLLATLHNALEKKRLAGLVDHYRRTFERQGCCSLQGASLPMQSVYRIIDSAAPSKATVFITGESGTGKELCAEAIHRLSPRRQQPLVVVNCAAIPKDLLESELFGHVKGAFTSAVGDREGAAARADGGTLFLDEICELEWGMQSKLLRFVQSGTLQRVGGNRAEKVDVRIVCATNRNPWAEVEAGRFREDLYYRLHVIPITMPPLRERGNDLLLIARHNLELCAQEEGKRFRAFHPEAEAQLLRYSWPGNVRQLLNVVRQTVVLNDGEEVTPAMLPPPVGDGRLPPPEETPFPVTFQPPVAPAIRPLHEVERAAIAEAIHLCGGNIPLAAQHLGVSPSTLYRKLQKWGEGVTP